MNLVIQIKQIDKLPTKQERQNAWNILREELKFIIRVCDKKSILMGDYIITSTFSIN